MEGAEGLNPYKDANSEDASEEDPLKAFGFM